MKQITIKTLQKSSFKIEIDEEQTVKALKEKIQANHGNDYPSSSQKLIYNGKILADESKLAEYNIDEKKFIVLMITRPPPVPKPPTPATTAEQATKSNPSASTATAVAAAAKKEEVKQPKTEDNQKSNKANTSSSSSAITPTTTTASAVSSAPTSTLASRTTTTNPDITTTTTTTASTPAQQPTIRPNPGIRSDSLDGGQMARLTAMMHQPQFRQIQDLIQQNPHLLSSTIEALASSDPDMYGFISENPDLFVNALNHPPLAGSRGPGSRVNAAGLQAGSQQIGAAREGQQGPALEQIVPNVSDHDKEAIERLKELGFPEVLVVQAYIACDKDEQLAANLLFQMD